VKRIVSFLLACCLVCTLIVQSIPCTALKVEAATQEAWLWPVADCRRVSSNFGWRDLYGSGYYDDQHRGIDISDGRSDLVVRASKSGTVITSINTCPHDNNDAACSCNGSAGNYIVIKHDDGTYSRYLHLRAAGMHSLGTVKQGETIGYVGSSGQSYGYHLHFDMCTDINNRNGTLLNPMPTNSEITIVNSYSLPSGWPSAKTTYIFDMTRPSKPVLKTTIEKNYITFTWGATDNTTHYNLWIDKKNDNGEWESQEQIFYAESGVGRFFQSGEYRAQLLSYNSNAWESDGSDWVHTWADDVYFSVEELKFITYCDENGNTASMDEYTKGTSFSIPQGYPRQQGSYFSGWAYEPDAEQYDLRPGDTVTINDDIILYPVFITHEQAVSGEEVYIFDISEFDDSNYNIETVEYTEQEVVDASYWTQWSDFSTSKVVENDTTQVRTTTLYRYYYFLCPSCGGHEPFYGTSDCGATIPSDAWNIGWFEIPYSESNYQTYSYTSKKYYTTSLGDGGHWIFSAGNLWDTAAGTKDASGSDEVISTGYSSRNYVERSETISKTVTAYKITPKQVEPVLNTISVSTTPYKTTYTIGEDVDTTGLALKLTYSDGSTKIITTGFTVSGFDSVTAGTKIVDVTYEGKIVSFTVTVTEPEPQIEAKIIVSNEKGLPGDTVTVPVSISDNPGIAGFTFVFDYDTSAMTLTGISKGTVLQDGTFTPNVAGKTLNWFNAVNVTENGTLFNLTFKLSQSAAVGDYSVTVALKDGKSTNFVNENAKAQRVTFGSGQISVLNPVMLTSVSIQSTPTKISYNIGEGLDTTGLTLKLTYSDGSSKTVTTGFTVSGFDSATAGTKTVTVTYEGKTTTFTVTVTEPEPEIDENAPKIVVSSGSGILGQQVQVAISLENNPGITSMLITVVYDTDVLQLVSVEDCEKLGIAFHSDNLTSPYTLSWANDTATSNYVVDGDIAVLIFNVLDTAAIGETAINISYDYDNYDIIDKDMNPIRFTTLSGNYTIRDVLVGDVNGDGKVNTLDRVVLTRYIAKWAEYTADDICIEAADVNSDGKVNTLDRVILTRYIAKWNGYTELPYAG